MYRECDKNILLWREWIDKTDSLNLLLVGGCADTRRPSRVWTKQSTRRWTTCSWWDGVFFILLCTQFLFQWTDNFVEKRSFTVIYGFFSNSDPLKKHILANFNCFLCLVKLEDKLLRWKGGKGWWHSRCADTATRNQTDQHKIKGHRWGDFKPIWFLAEGESTVSFALFSVIQVW